ncbi:MAG: alpha/beta hydrolase, partial [Bacteroidota bacterium]
LSPHAPAIPPVKTTNRRIQIINPVVNLSAKITTPPMDGKPKFPPIYVLPGLGTDVALFDKIDSKNDWGRLDWIMPASPGESLSSYASRMASAIPATEEPVLLGVSFGGVIAQEIAQIRPVKGVILVSSLVSPAEKPWWLHLFRHVPLYRLGKGDWRIRTVPIWAPLWGITHPDEQQFLQEMFARADDRVRMWSVAQLANWGGCTSRVPVLRLHGDRDGLFTVAEPESCEMIAGGTHFMIWQQADYIRKRIRAWMMQDLSATM